MNIYRRTRNVSLILKTNWLGTEEWFEEHLVIQLHSDWWLQLFRKQTPHGIKWLMMKGWKCVLLELQSFGSERTFATYLCCRKYSYSANTTVGHSAALLNSIWIKRRTWTAANMKLSYTSPLSTTLLLFLEFWSVTFMIYVLNRKCFVKIFKYFNGPKSKRAIYQPLVIFNKM